jgi:hypothetical protein
MRIYALLFLLIFFQAAEAQPGYPAGAYLAKLHFTDGTLDTYMFVSTTDSTLTVATLADVSQHQTFSCTSLYQLDVRKLTRVKRNTLAGAGAGFLIGFAVGWSAYESEQSPTREQLGHGLGAGVLGAFVGGLAGNLSGRLTKSYFIFGSQEQFSSLLPSLKKYTLPNTSNPQK